MKRRRVNNNPERICPECGKCRKQDKGVLFDSNDTRSPCLRCKFRLSKRHPAALASKNGHIAPAGRRAVFRTPREKPTTRDID